MDLDGLAQHLADPERIGLSAALVDKLKIVPAEATRGRLLVQTDGERGHLVVQFLGCYVIDDTDFFGDGEIYWWSVPVLVNEEGQVEKNVLHGLPSGMPDHKCGDHEWMTNLSLADPPVWAVIPPGEGYQRCVIRVGIYDDDREPADVPAALGAGLEALAAASDQPLSGPDAIIGPVRDAIYAHLKAEDDDILIDQDILIRKGDNARFGAGMIGSVINAMARAYYFVRDIKHTRQFGPVTLHKGQVERVRFDVPIAQGGRVAIFARGHDVGCPTFGDLNVDTPFLNRVITQGQEVNLEDGFDVMGNGPAKLVAFYTPSYSD